MLFRFIGRLYFWLVIVPFVYNFVKDITVKVVIDWHKKIHDSVLEENLDRENEDDLDPAQL